MAQIWRQSFQPGEIEAAVAGLKRRFRVPIMASNTRGESLADFERIDWNRASRETPRPDCATGLHARNRDGRMVSLAPALKVGDVIFPGTPRDPLEKAVDSLLVTGVSAERLRDISDQDATLEGVAAAWCLRQKEMRLGPNDPGRIYLELVAKLGPTLARRWRMSEEHLRACGGVQYQRASFAVDWILNNRGGIRSWHLNPWVWVVRFEYFRANPCEVLCQLETQRRSA